MLDESATTGVNLSVLDTSMESQQPVVMATPLPQQPDNNAPDTRLSRHTDATTNEGHLWHNI